jgi:hypothetical protein
MYELLFLINCLTPGSDFPMSESSQAFYIHVFDLDRI